MLSRGNTGHVSHIYAPKTANSSMFNFNAQYIMAFFSKYSATMLLVWFMTFFSGMIGKSSPLQVISLAVGTLLGIITILSKVWEMVERYQRDTIREEIRELIREDKFDEEERQQLRKIINN